MSWFPRMTSVSLTWGHKIWTEHSLGHLKPGNTYLSPLRTAIQKDLFFPTTVIQFYESFLSSLTPEMSLIHTKDLDRARRDTVGRLGALLLTSKVEGKSKITHLSLPRWLLLLRKQEVHWGALVHSQKLHSNKWRIHTKCRTVELYPNITGIAVIRVKINLQWWRGKGLNIYLNSLCFKQLGALQTFSVILILTTIYLTQNLCR